ncbi:MAG: hypothetical protein JWP82_2937 [Humibacillus sp.]|nr:hypothetical protein [Humibacillus sp.]
MPVADTPPPGFYAPDLYSGRWLWIGLGVLLLVALWSAFVILSTRPRRVRIPPRVTTDRLTRLRADYARQIDLVLDLVARGELTQRAGHQRLSVLVRHFVQEVSGIHAPTMTLTELTATGERLTPVAQVVSDLYPGEFGPDEARSLAGAGAVAKEVVARWT